MVNCFSEQATGTVELLQDIFTRPWKDLHMTNVPSLADVASFLRKDPPPVSSIGQVKAAVRQLNPRKATGSDTIPAWLLRRFCEELATVVHDIICSSMPQCNARLGHFNS